MRYIFRVVAIAFVVAVSPWAVAQTDEEILATFELHPDFRLEIAAREPLIFDPVDLDFDEQGRAFVVEMPGYPSPVAPGHIVLLGDEDGDGVFDTRTEFAGGFEVAVSVMAYDGGLLVASPPDILFLKDTDGDGVADQRETLISGFAVDNQQHNFNGLTYGIDNWIYGANGGNGGSPYWAGVEDDRISIRSQDFRFHVPTKGLERYGRTTGGFGITFDDYGRHFGTHNLTHISHIVFPGRFLESLPLSRQHSLHYNISDHDQGKTGRIFPLGLQETRVNHPEQSGYFSGACGITHYGGGAFPAEFQGNIFVCDVVLNLVHRDIISPDGATLRASRARERVDFLASRNRAFRPVNMTVGPDGALYVIDMHREVIEHPEWIPDELEENMDLNAGKQQGRIFRIVPKAGIEPRPLRFSRDDIPAVVAMLADKNQWRRNTAQRLLVEWQDSRAVAPLQALFDDSDNALARLHALHTLDGLAALSDATLRAALGDPDPGLRENAIQLTQSRIATNAALRDAVVDATGDGTPRVRMQAALVLGTLDDPPTEALLAMAARDLGDPWLRRALYSALGQNPGPSLGALIGSPESLDQDGAESFVRDLAQLVGYTANARSLGNTLDALAGSSALPTALKVSLLDGIAAGLEDRSDAPALKPRRLGHWFESDSPELVRPAWRIASAVGIKNIPGQASRLAAADAIVIDPARTKSDRLAQLALYAFAPFDVRVDTLFELLDKDYPVEIQRAAIEQLKNAHKTDVAQRLVEIWDTLGRQTVGAAGDILLRQRANHGILLDALESGDLAIGQLNLHLERRRTLLHSRDDDVRRRAEALFTDAGVVTRRAAIEAMRPALALNGDVAKGRAVFTELCTRCHQIGGEGATLGPDLTDIFRKSPETLLHDILDPNAAVAPEFVSYAIETNDGEFMSGIVASESDTSVTLREAEEKETTIPRANIREMFSSGLSIMPEELEVGMEHQTFANLLAFLLEPR